MFSSRTDYTPTEEPQPMPNRPISRRNLAANRQNTRESTAPATRPDPANPATRLRTPPKAPPRFPRAQKAKLPNEPDSTLYGSPRQDGPNNRSAAAIINNRQELPLLRLEHEQVPSVPLAIRLEQPERLLLDVLRLRIPGRGAEDGPVLARLKARVDVGAIYRAERKKGPRNHGG